jgi:signal transduction histidine kinase
VVPARVVGRADDLSRLVGHLLDNAARHARSSIEVSMDAGTNGHVHVYVDDDGPGVPASQREAVFERFGRLQEGRSRDSGGAGLGLAVVKRIAERHGGRVTITSSPSLGGARFDVALPWAWV